MITELGASDQFEMGYCDGDVLFAHIDSLWLYRFCYQYAPPFVHMGICVSGRTLLDAMADFDEQERIAVKKDLQRVVHPDGKGSEADWRDDAMFVIEAAHGGPTIVTVTRFIDRTNKGGPESAFGMMRFHQRPEAAESAARWAADRLVERETASLLEASQYAYGDFALASIIVLRSKLRESDFCDENSVAEMEAGVREAETEISKAKRRLAGGRILAASADEPRRRVSSRADTSAWTCITFVYDAYQTACPGLLRPVFAEGTRLTADSQAVFAGDDQLGEPSPNDLVPGMTQAQIARYYDMLLSDDPAALQANGDQETFLLQKRSVDVERLKTAQGYIAAVSKVVRLGLQYFSWFTTANLLDAKSIPIERAICAADLWNTDADVERWARWGPKTEPRTIRSDGVRLPIARTQ